MYTTRACKGPICWFLGIRDLAKKAFRYSGGLANKGNAAFARSCFMDGIADDFVRMETLIQYPRNFDQATEAAKNAETLLRNSAIRSRLSVYADPTPVTNVLAPAAPQPPAYDHATHVPVQPAPAPPPAPQCIPPLLNPPPWPDPNPHSIRPHQSQAIFGLYV